MFSIRYNRTTNHITGFDLSASATDATMNTCGTVTRSTLAQGKTFETLAEVAAYVKSNQRKVCKNCLKALDAALAAEEAAAQAEVAETVAPVAQTVTETVAPLDASYLPATVTMDANRILTGPVADLKDLYRRRIAGFTLGGDLVLL